MPSPRGHGVGDRDEVITDTHPTSATSAPDQTQQRCTSVLGSQRLGRAKVLRQNTHLPPVPTKCSSSSTPSTPVQNETKMSDGSFGRVPRDLLCQLACFDSAATTLRCSSATTPRERPPQLSRAPPTRPKRRVSKPLARVSRRTCSICAAPCALS